MVTPKCPAAAPAIRRACTEIVTAVESAGRRVLQLDRPCLMGIVNLTPDSFSGDGLAGDPDQAVARAMQMQADGAALVDLGGESTRPGALPVDAAAECERVLPVLERLVAAIDLPVSLDTSNPELMHLGAAAGAALINDVRALRRPGALDAAAESGLPVCLMHMRGEPGHMQQAPRYDDVIGEVLDFLDERVRACERAGIDRARLLVDPGFGFGKTLAHNLDLLRRLPEIAALGLPVVVGLSRKSMIGALSGAPVEQRVYGSVAAALLAAQRGAAVLRVHDVSATAQALAVLDAVDGVPGPVPGAARHERSRAPGHGAERAMSDKV